MSKRRYRSASVRVRVARNDVWVDWVMPWVILFPAAYFWYWVLSLWIGSMAVAPLATPLQQNNHRHPSLERAWDAWHRSGRKAPLPPEDDDY